ncbi:MAG: hypothetical protein KDA27_10515 [Candidatus Eisenbacteria bacterium]|uniref:Big-1 domain-containing protein n=1 Tax=Eiseniibacteriota bacterium TaxID=2212470 RepID=A0A956NBN7_UNCEI|nr:hypothetical protein [Candidatus Eisenbacteria bacterium]
MPKSKVNRLSRVLTLALVTVFSSLLASRTFADTGSIGVLVIPSGTLALTTPDPANNWVLPCDELDGVVLAPDSPAPIPASEIQVGVRNNNNGPVPNATVVVEFNQGPIQLCPNGVFTAITNEQGIAYLTLAGGGCLSETPLSAVIKANGVTIRNYANVKSPDFDGSGADLVVNLADLVQFSAEFLGNGPAVCHDYDNNGTTDLGDLIIFSPAFVAGAHCP